MLAGLTFALVEHVSRKAGRALLIRPALLTPLKKVAAQSAGAVGGQILLLALSTLHLKVVGTFAGQTVGGFIAAGQTGAVGRQVVERTGARDALPGRPEALSALGEAETAGFVRCVVVEHIAVAQFVYLRLAAGLGLDVGDEDAVVAHELSPQLSLQPVHFLPLRKMQGLEREDQPHYVILPDRQELPPRLQVGRLVVESIVGEVAVGEAVLGESAGEVNCGGVLQEEESALGSEGQAIDQLFVYGKGSVLLVLGVVGEYRVVFCLVFCGYDQGQTVGFPGQIHNLAAFLILDDGGVLLSVLHVAHKQSSAHRAVHRPHTSIVRYHNPIAEIFSFAVVQQFFDMVIRQGELCEENLELIVGVY